MESSANNTLTLDEVKMRLKEIFEDTFEYPFLDKEFKGVKSKITVTCPVHGNITKPLQSMLYKHTGCQKCGHIRKIISMRSNREAALKEMITFYKFIRNPPPGVILYDKERYGVRAFYQNACSAYNQYRLIQGHISFSD